MNELGSLPFFFPCHVGKGIGSGFRFDSLNISLSGFIPFSAHRDRFARMLNNLRTAYKARKVSNCCFSRRWRAVGYAVWYSFVFN